MSGIINRIGAESGIIGTTEAAPGLASDVIGGTKRTYSGYESRTFLDGGTINFIESTKVFFSANDSLYVIAIIERASMITSIFFILLFSNACNKTYMIII